MGSYYSTTKNTSSDSSPESSVISYPQNPLFRDILFNKYQDFVSKCEQSDGGGCSEKVFNEEGEDPIQYICELGVTQQRYDMLCYMIEKNYHKIYETTHEVIRPLLNRNGSLVKCYLLRLLLTLSDTIPLDQVSYSTTSEANYSLFVEYGLADRIVLLPEIQNEPRFTEGNIEYDLE